MYLELVLAGLSLRCWVEKINRENLQERLLAFANTPKSISDPNCAIWGFAELVIVVTVGRELLLAYSSPHAISGPSTYHFAGVGVLLQICSVFEVALKWF